MDRVEKQINFIRTDIIELLNSSKIEEINSLLGQEYKYSYTNRQDSLAEIFSSLNSNDQNLILISGFQGTGKTTFISTVLASLEQNVLGFYYECSLITNLDDIILSFYRFLHKHCSKTGELTRTGFVQQSIDEKLINYLKNLKRPVLITIDGVENIFKEKVNSVDKELIAFLNYILDIPLCKVILSGRKIPPALKTKNEDPLTIRLGGLDEADSLKILNDYELNTSESTLFQLYEISRGYPENLHIFANSVKELNLDAFELIKNYSFSTDSFEEYIIKVIYDHIPEEYKKILYTLAIIRHSVNLFALKQLNIAENIDEAIDYLTKIKLLTKNREYFYLKNLTREYIYKNIPFFEKVKIHKFFHELYSEQITKKIDERLFPISRKLLHSEQYYNYITLTKLDKNFTLDNSQKIQYTSDTHLVSAYKIKEPSQNTQKNEENDSQKTKIKEISKQDFVYDDTNLTIELTEEEKLLLGEDNLPDTDVSTSDQNDNGTVVLDDSIFEYETDNINYPFSINALEQQYIKFEDTNDLAGMANSSMNIADIYYNKDNLDNSAVYYDKAYQLYLGSNDIEKAFQALLKLASVYSDSYKHDLALINYHKIIDSEKVPVKTYIEALMGMAEIYDYREELEAALKYYNEAYQKAKNTSDAEILAVLCFKTALVYDDMKNYDKALEFYKLNTETTDDVDINPNLSSAYANMALIYEELNNKTLAIDYYIKSLDIDIKINSFEDQYKTLSRLGNLYFEDGNIDKAFESFHRELAVAKTLNDPYSIAMSFLDIGDLYLYLKNYEKAVKAFILARQTIGSTISTDSKEKIERRFRHVKSEITEAGFEAIVKTLHKKV